MPKRDEVADEVRVEPWCDGATPPFKVAVCCWILLDFGSAIEEEAERSGIMEEKAAEDDVGYAGMAERSAAARARASSLVSNEVDGDRDSMEKRPRSPSRVFDGDSMPCEADIGRIHAILSMWDARRAIATQGSLSCAIYERSSRPSWGLQSLGWM